MAPNALERQVAWDRAGHCGPVLGSLLAVVPGTTGKHRLSARRAVTRPAPSLPSGAGRSDQKRPVPLAVAT